jgi:thiol-disulfide isomerase/thioredoxin
MEGAVRSGYLAAECLLSDLGRPRPLLRPDLPSSPLARLLLPEALPAPNPVPEAPTRPYTESKAVREPWRVWCPGSPPIDSSGFDSLVAHEPYVVLHFWAEWNGHDRQLDKVLAPLRDEFAGRVAFRSVDIERPDLEPIWKACGVKNVTELACFAHGKKTASLIGIRSTAEYKKMLSELVGDGLQARG